jgi:RNA polymerase sigma-70 factor (ECF subfamily)
MSPGRTDAALARVLEDLRPRLHRYCARMAGSVIDGEDILQEAFLKILESFPGFTAVDNPGGWTFRVTHRVALDFLRRRARRSPLAEEEEVMDMADERAEVDARLAAAAGLATFMQLSVPQRSSVILMDVLGYTLDEIAEITGASQAAVKSSLHRGRASLRELAAAPDQPPARRLDQRQAALLAAYAARFNARDFAGVRDLLAEEVRLEVVARTTLRGRDAVAGTYLANYAASTDWQLAPGLVEGRPALLVSDPDPSASDGAVYFILLEWRDDGLVVAGRDFRHARYVMDGAEVEAI